MLNIFFINHILSPTLGKMTTNLNQIPDETPQNSSNSKACHKWKVLLRKPLWFRTNPTSCLFAWFLSFFLSSYSISITFFFKLIFFLFLFFLSKSVDLVSKTGNDKEFFYYYFIEILEAIFKHLFLVSCWSLFMSTRMGKNKSTLFLEKNEVFYSYF